MAIMKSLIVSIVSLLFILPLNAQFINLDSLEKQYAIQPSKQEKLKIANELFDEYQDMDSGKALFYGNEILKSYRNDDELIKLADHNVKMARFFKNNVQYLEALNHYINAYDIYRDLEDHKNIAKMHHSISRVYKRLGTYDKAMSHSLSAIDLFGKFQDSLNLAKAYNCMGSVYKYIDDYEKAIYYYNKNLTIITNLNKKNLLPSTLNNIAIVYERMGNYAIAKSYYERSIELGKFYDEDVEIFINNLGNIHLIQKNYKQAKECFLKSIAISKSNSNKRGLGISFSDLGTYYYEVDSLGKAREYYNKALNIIENSGIAESKKNLYYKIHNVYRKEHDFQNAYLYYKKYKKISDEILNSEIVKKVANLEWEQRYVNEKNELELKQAKSRQLVLIGVGLVVLILLLILFYAYKQKVKLKNEKLAKENSELQTKQVEAELHLKNKELTNYAIQQVRNSEITDQVIKELEETKENLKGDNRRIIQSTITNLKTKNKADSWKEFEIRFLEVHQDFYNNLSREFDLTTNELKLCAFLRLNMSSKEISAITNQTSHSINIARGRLRKKLKITGTNTNLHHLLAQY